LVGGVDLTGVVIEDDAEDELSSVLERARKIRQAEIKKEDTEVDSAAKSGKGMGSGVLPDEDHFSLGEARKILSFLTTVWIQNE
uniref:Polyprotein n=1 Tax=Anisakis simplex TaxID=6269 RepID=A0A0M3JPH3_ANISI